MPDFVYFWAAILKTFLHLNLAQLNLSKSKISCGTKHLKFGTKNTTFGCLSRILKKTIAILEMSTLEFVKMKKIQIKPKNIKFRTTIIWLHVGYNLKNTIAIFEISTL